MMHMQSQNDINAYADFLVLPTFRGAYRLENEPRMYVSRHVQWAKYYQEAMKISKVMVFLASPAWMKSPNCLQEVQWAIDMVNNEMANAKFIAAVTSECDDAEKLQQATDMLSKLAGLADKRYMEIPWPKDKKWGPLPMIHELMPMVDKAWNQDTW